MGYSRASPLRSRNAQQIVSRLKMLNPLKSQDKRALSHRGLACIGLRTSLSSMMPSVSLEGRNRVETTDWCIVSVVPLNLYRFLLLVSPLSSVTSRKLCVELMRNVSYRVIVTVIEHTSHQFGEGVAFGVKYSLNNFRCKTCRTCRHCSRGPSVLRYTTPCGCPAIYKRWCSILRQDTDAPCKCQ